jgi:hypothetical protein
VRAFNVRWRDAHERKVRTAVWEDAVKAIEAVRKDIYEQNCKDGSTKIVNMPKGLKTDAANLLVNIVHGRARIVPPGMEKHGIKTKHKGAAALTAEPTNKKQRAVNHSSTHAHARSHTRLLALSPDTYVGPGSAPAPVLVDVNDLSNHQYLKEMQYRKGGYAILMAFQKERQRRGVDFQGPLLKREIISLAQVRDLCSASFMRRKTLQQLPCRACPPAF